MSKGMLEYDCSDIAFSSISIILLEIVKINLTLTFWIN